MGRFPRTILVAAVTVCALNACQSKFSDKDPAPGGQVGFTAEGRIAANEEIDKKLSKLENYTERVRQLLRALRRVEKARLNQDVYTQIDFMMDMNSELKKTAAEQKDGGWVKYSSMKLNVKGVSEDCRNVQTMLRADDANLYYGLKTCRTGDRFLEVLEVNLADNKVGMKFNNENIQKVLQDTIVPAINAETNCEITTDAKQIVLRTSCTKLTTKLSVSESLVINSVTYDRLSDIRLDLDGEILENGVNKGVVKFTVPANGKTTFDIHKTN
jgi:hypothetical protein